jgi:NAD(P)-dependent dehydrogenase (short-subunit alcohol dehydrogenase family)
VANLIYIFVLRERERAFTYYVRFYVLYSIAEHYLMMINAAHRRIIHLRRMICTGSTSSDDKGGVVLILGAGKGIGQHVAQKFSKNGYHACVVRRGRGPNRLLTDDGKMDEFVSKLKDQGGQASVFFADATKEEDITSLIDKIETNVGPIECAVYNVGAQMGNIPLEKTSMYKYQLALKMGAVGPFLMAKTLSPYMTKRGRGTMIFTSATAAFRGNEMQHAHTAAMGARRMLCQSLNHELAPKGVHICHVNIDDVVDSPETIGIMMPEIYEKVIKARRPAFGVVLPEDVADTYYHIHTQRPSAWTFELDLRSWKSKPWFNG